MFTGTVIVHVIKLYILMIKLNATKSSARLRGWSVSSRTLKSNNHSMNEAIVMAQNHPLWRLMSTFVAMHS